MRILRLLPGCLSVRIVYSIAKIGEINFVTSICVRCKRLLVVVKCIDGLSASSVLPGIKQIMSLSTTNCVMLFRDDTAVTSNNYAVFIYRMSREECARLRENVP